MSLLTVSRPSIVSAAEFEADKASLLRMLTDFQRDYSATAAAALAAANSSSSSIVPSAVASSPSLPVDIDAINQGMQVGNLPKGSHVGKFECLPVGLSKSACVCECIMGTRCVKVLAC